MSTFKNRNWTGGRGGGGGRGSSGGGRGGGGYRSKWGSQSQRSGIYIGTRGFFITVEGLGKERGAIREAQNLYDSIIASLPSTTLPLPSTNEKRDEPADVEQQAESLDAADELTAACSAEKASANESNIVGGGGAQGDGGSHVSTRIWQMDTSVKNCLFFSSSLPVDQLYAISETLVDRCQARAQCRYVARWLPVEECCNTELPGLETALERLIHSHFVANWKGESAPSYALEFKARNNHSITRQQVLDILDVTIKGLSPLSRVNLTSPDLTILVNIVQSRALLSCIRDFHVKRKYSMRPPEPKKEENANAAVATDANDAAKTTDAEEDEAENDDAAPSATPNDEEKNS